MTQEKFLIKAARKSHLNFMAYCWKSMDEFTIGFHTKKICHKIDKAIENYRNGKSTYLAIAVHNRSGKSQIVSRYLPPHFLGEFPDNSVITATYSQDTAYTFSTAAIRVLQTPEYKKVYPDVVLKKGQAKEWVIASNRKEEYGHSYAASLYAGLTGKGAHLAILDDYCKNREEAESPTMRQKSWDAFTNDFMTRLAPVHIVIILATPWHVDDIRGRIKEEMKKDPRFPKFEFIDFPAKKEDYDGIGQYPTDYLFEERMGAEWYKSMYSILGPYAAASILDCSPTVRGGAILDSTKITVHKKVEEFPTGIKYCRVWDLGHKIKKKGKKQPDPTGGTLLGFRKIAWNQELKIPIVELWVKHYIEFREGSYERDKMIKQYIHQDGIGTDLLLESTTDSLDMVNQVRTLLSGIKVVNTLTVSKSKAARIAPLEGVFAAGNVHILKGSWNERWIQGIEQFDGSETTHDEMIDNMASGYEWLVWRGRIPKTARW